MKGVVMGGTEKICIVGAGPCGLLAARHLKRLGVPYDHFERHSDTGGIWDIENPGSPVYESAHFISSRYRSSFYGFQMPESWPDYPNHRLLLSYIRDFAKAFDLKSAITFSTTVESAVPVDEGKGGWDVTLKGGERRHYAGVICAPGVTWHAAMPDYPGQADFHGEMRHSVSYTRPEEFRGKRVLIIGAGNSGVDIACDAAQFASAAAISLRRGYHFVPKHIFGIPLDMLGTDQFPLPDGASLPSDFAQILKMVTGDITRLGLAAPDHAPFQSHPIMNTQILHHLAHGDITAKGDVAHFDEKGAVFKDGSRLDLDMVLFATGYECRIPFIDPALFSWKGGRPELYLNIFHRTLQGLAVVGFVEFASAGYQRFDDMAAMAAMDVALAREGGARLADWRALKANDTPDLRGDHHYIDSPRHANYVDVSLFRSKLVELRKTFGFPDPSDALFAPMRATSVSH